MTGSKELFEEQRQYESREKGSDTTSEDMSLTIDIKHLQPSREWIKQASDNLFNAADQGTINPLELAVKMKYIVKVWEDAEPRMRKYILDELSKHGRSAFLFGSEVVPMETGVKYDYTLCGDAVLNDLLNEKEAIDAKVKVRQEFLKGLSAEGLVVVNEDTGECTKLMPPTKSSTSSYKVGFK